MKDVEQAKQDFIEWFVANYPGPHTVITDPNWHAPKIWSAATRQLIRQIKELEQAEQEVK